MNSVPLFGGHFIRKGAIFISSWSNRNAAQRSDWLMQFKVTRTSGIMGISLLCWKSSCCVLNPGASMQSNGDRVHCCCSQRRIAKMKSQVGSRGDWSLYHCCGIPARRPISGTATATDALSTSMKTARREENTAHAKNPMGHWCQCHSNLSPS